MEISVKAIGEDYWGRKLFRNTDNNHIYAMVDGVLHSTTRDGEPQAPLRKDLKINFVE